MTVEARGGRPTRAQAMRYGVGTPVVLREVDPPPRPTPAPHLVVTARHRTLLGMCQSRRVVWCPRMAGFRLHSGHAFDAGDLVAVWELYRSGLVAPVPVSAIPPEVLAPRAVRPTSRGMRELDGPDGSA